MGKSDGQFRARTKSFVRRSRGMPANLSRVLETHGDKYIVPIHLEGSLTTVAEGEPLDWANVFGNTAPLVIEVGSGNGEQIVNAAQQNPDTNYLAFEVWRPGVAKTISRAVAAKVENLRIVEADAAQALPALVADGTAQEVWTFFPDPWRKKRHHKRRLVDTEFADAVSRVLVPEGNWRLATDWNDYAWQMRDVVERCELMVNPHQGERPDPEDPEPKRGGFSPRFSGRILTRFEMRGLDEGRTIHDITALKPAAQRGESVAQPA